MTGVDGAEGAPLIEEERLAGITHQFLEDVADHCRSLLVAGGYTVPASDPGHVLLHYFNVLKRRIVPARRRVWYPHEFQCPNEHLAGIRQLARAIEKGNDINPHQSRSLRSAAYQDGLLNAWGIHHFHLGTQLRSDGFIDRTGPLLFARVDPADIYFLAVANHGNWTMQELIRILHANWPDVIARFKIPGVMRSRKNLSDEEIAILRRSRLNHMLQMPDGTIYMGPGGGYSADGSSTDAVVKRIQVLRLCRYFATLVKDHEHLLVQGCAEKGVRIAPPYQFRLRIVDGVVVAWEANNNVALWPGTPLHFEPIT